MSNETELLKHEQAHEAMEDLKMTKQAEVIASIQREKQKNYDAQVSKLKGEFPEIAEKIATFYRQDVPGYINTMVATLETLNQQFDELCDQESHLTADLERLKAEGQMLRVSNELVKIFSDIENAIAETKIHPEFETVIAHSGRLVNTAKSSLRFLTPRWSEHRHSLINPQTVTKLR